MVQYQVRNVIKVAIKLEKEAYELYKAFFDLTKDYLLQTVFEELMESEKEHQKLFEDMLVSFEKGQVSAEAEDPSEYLNIAGTVIQPSKSVEEIMRNITAVDEALDYAIDKEKEAMAFYSDLKMKVNEENQRIIEEIINQENQHISMLIEEKNKLGL